MKNLVTFFLSVILSVSIHAQITTHTFEIAGNWSTVNNWKNSLIADDSTKEAILRADAVIDADFTVNSIFIHQNDTLSRTISSIGANALTIDPDSAPNTGIINKSSLPIDLLISGNIIIDNSASGEKGVIQTNNNLGNSVEFLNNSLLTLNTALKMRNYGGPTVLNGNMAGSSTMSFIGVSNVIFGPTADNTAFTGFLTFTAAGTVVSNTLVPGGLLPPNTSLRCNGSGGVMQINGANSLEGNVSRQGPNNFLLDFNADQSAIGHLSIGTGTLTLDVDAGVNNLAFANSAARTWAGTLNIVGFRENVIRFGTDSTGLTAAQLSMITHDGPGGRLKLDANGYLIYDPIILPVSLGMFRAEVVDQAVLIHWNTLIERNHDFFTLEKSFDGQNFEAIGTQQAKGTSNTPKHYELLDRNPQKGLNYYRLVLTDFDGNSQYSHSISVDFQEEWQIHFYPNPVRDQLTIQAPVYEQVLIQIVDMKGQRLIQQRQFIDKEVVIDVSELAAGLYFLQVKLSNESHFVVPSDNMFVKY